MSKKNLKSLKDFQEMDKGHLITTLMQNTIKGGCCSPSPSTYTETSRNNRAVDYLNDDGYIDEIL